MKKLTLILTLLLAGMLASAQTGSMWTLDWEAAVPVGTQSNEMMAENSFQGLVFEYRHCFRPNIILGGRVGYNSYFYDRGLGSAEIDGQPVYGYIENKLGTVPIMLTGAYLFNSRKLVPYAGLGLGVYYMKYETLVKPSTLDIRNSWHFGVSPEVGITIPFIISNFGLNINTKYNYAVKTGKAPAFSWFSFGVGFSFMY